MKKATVLFLCFFFVTGIFAQQYEIASNTNDSTSFDEMSLIAAKIVEASGKKANFKLVIANVPNALAVVHNGKRYIYYNPHFISKMNRYTGTKWAAVSILAHEIGHHLYGPSINKGKIPLATELEADEFSGYVLQKLGASLEESEAAMRVIGNPYATTTHPARSDRIRSIEDGWTNAGGVVEDDWE